jgi:endonuclease/exonuclease/phosphatase (EEP) superfamily protein YafD
MCYNVRSSNRDVGAVAAVIASESPDLVVVRELEPAMASALEPRLVNDYPHYRIEPGIGGFWSRYEILAYETWQLSEDRAYWAQRMTLDVEGRRLTVVGVHLRYGPVLQGVQMLGTPLVMPVGRAGGSYTDVDNLVERLEEVDGPLIVMGDFNMTDQQGAYAGLLQHLRDSHRESGWGMGFTQAPLHRIKLAMLRIDYVFYSPDLVSLSTRVGRYGGSDHRPVVARLAWNRSR